MPAAGTVIGKRNVLSDVQITFNLPGRLTKSRECWTDRNYGKEIWVSGFFSHPLVPPSAVQTDVKGRWKDGR